MTQKSRKELLRAWSQERIDALLAAEKNGSIKEVPGGWMIEDHFYEKFPFKGEMLTSYLCMIAHKHEKIEDEYGN